MACQNLSGPVADELRDRGAPMPHDRRLVPLPCRHPASPAADGAVRACIPHDRSLVTLPCRHPAGPAVDGVVPVCDA